MSEVVESEEMKEVEEKPRKGVVTPSICSWTNDEGTGTIVEIYLPGVEKDTIKLKMDSDNIFVAGETDTLRYIGGYGLCCPVEAKEARSTYKNGLLRIEIPFMDITLETVDVKIE